MDQPSTRRGGTREGDWCLDPHADFVVRAGSFPEFKGETSAVAGN